MQMHQARVRRAEAAPLLGGLLLIFLDAAPITLGRRGYALSSRKVITWRAIHISSTGYPRGIIPIESTKCRFYAVIRVGPTVVPSQLHTRPQQRKDPLFGAGSITYICISRRPFHIGFSANHNTSALRNRQQRGMSLGEWRLKVLLASWQRGRVSMCDTTWLLFLGMQRRGSFHCAALLTDLASVRWISFLCRQLTVTGENPQVCGSASAPPTGIRQF